jgi:hypothetical protein
MNKKAPRMGIVLVDSREGYHYRDYYSMSLHYIMRMKYMDVTAESI